jgi:hypothetical protein
MNQIKKIIQNIDKENLIYKKCYAMKSHGGDGD